MADYREIAENQGQEAIDRLKKKDEPKEDKSFLEKFKDALVKETSGPNMIEQMRDNPEFLKESFDKQTKAPYAALRSAVGKAQEGDFEGALAAPFNGGANADLAPTWSDIAKKAGIKNETALKAVQTVGDLAANQVGMMPGVAGTLQKVEGQGVKFASEIPMVAGQKIVQKITPAAESYVGKKGLESIAQQEIADAAKLSASKAGMSDIARGNEMAATAALESKTKEAVSQFYGPLLAKATTQAERDSILRQAATFAKVYKIHNR